LEQLSKGTEGVVFLALFALGLIEDFSVGPWVEGCLGQSFLLAMDFLRADKVGSGEGSVGAASLRTVGLSGGPCSSGVIYGSLRDDSSGEETISSISGGDYLEDPPCLRDFRVL